jgi:hypothetical protein
MSIRCCVLALLGPVLILASGCPEPGEEGGDEWGFETGETGGTGGSADPTGDGDRAGDSGGGSGGIDPDGDVRPPLDTGDGDGDSGSDPDEGDDEGDTDGGPWDHLERCWDRTWNGDTLPAVILDNTIGRNDDLTASCGIGPAPDFQLGFVAPWTGTFTFDTDGSSFDTVLAIHPGECSEPELVCNDDFIALESRVSLQLEQFEIVTVTVDGTGPFEEGPLKLTITEAEPPSCEAEMIIPDLPQQLLGDTTDGPDELASGCGGEGAPEQVYEFIAPGPGTYHFDTFGSAFDTVLYTLDACDGPPLACNDDANLELQSELFVELIGGQKILVVVDGHGAGDFGAHVLNVEKL